MIADASDSVIQLIDIRISRGSLSPSVRRLTGLGQRTCPRVASASSWFDWLVKIAQAISVSSHRLPAPPR
jgi:hypothetical protein